VSGPRREIVFVVERGRLSPAAHKRVYDIVPLLGARGYRCHVVSWDWELLWSVRTRVQAGNRPLAAAMYALNAVRATPSLLRARDRFNRERIVALLRTAHAVVINQCTLNDDWRALLADHARHVVYEFDDAVWLRDEAAVDRMLEIADTAVAGSAFLAEYARHRHQNVRIIPTGVRVDRYSRAAPRDRSAGETFTVGWVGSPSTTKYLELIAEPLERLAALVPVSFVVVGAGTAPLPRISGVDVRSYPAIPYDPADYVPQFDVGVMPLTDGEAERGKCGAKALEYMAAGIPAVCSPVGVNREIVEDGVSGFLAGDPDAWVEILARLASDEELRRAVGRAGLERVKAAYSAEVVAAAWDELFRLESIR
jgi:glycosyltransferase involved in cell wall biosynthesis